MTLTPHATRVYERTRAHAAKPVIRGTMSNIWAEAAGIRSARKDEPYSLCRALASAGYAGSLSLVDAETGQERLFVRDIAAAALRTARENDAQGPHRCKYQEVDFASFTPAKSAAPDLAEEEEI